MVHNTKSINDESNIPKYLIYEIINGLPVYYKDYEQVLNKTNTLADIIGCSTLQAFILNYLLRILYSNLSDDDYLILSNEIGGHLGKNNNLSFDIAVFDTTVLTADKITTHYADVPPKVVIEVDLDGKMKGHSDYEYIDLKTQKLLDFGTEKVYWIITKIQKVIVATPNQDWQIISWDKDVPLFETSFNISAYLKKKGVNLEE